MAITKIKVSNLDIRHLKIIRSNVKKFISTCADKYDKKGKFLLDIAPQDYLGAREFFKKTEIKTLDINPLSGADYIADLCNRNEKLIHDQTFDYVLCTEVLEHTYDPFSSVNEIYRILKKGGYVFATMPFNFRIHGPLPDCWRFTEHGLRYLFRDFLSLKINAIETKNRGLMPVHYSLIGRK